MEVVQRRKFKKYFSATDLQELMTKIRTKAEFISVTTSVDLCRDPKDNFLLSLAQDGKATHLLTGDKALLVLEKLGKTKIQTLTSYLSKM